MITKQMAIREYISMIRGHHLAPAQLHETWCRYVQHLAACGSINDKQAVVWQQYTADVLRGIGDVT